MNRVEEELKQTQGNIPLTPIPTAVKPYKLVFMDYSMPIMDGIQTTKQIVQSLTTMGLDPNNTEQSPYICCLSAYSEPTFVERAKAAGMHDYMTKPAQIQKI